MISLNEISANVGCSGVVEYAGDCTGLYIKVYVICIQSRCIVMMLFFVHTVALRLIFAQYVTIEMSFSYVSLRYAYRICNRIDICLLWVGAFVYLNQMTTDCVKVNVNKCTHHVITADIV